jgi:hypothetical protein
VGLVHDHAQVPSATPPREVRLPVVDGLDRGHDQVRTPRVGRAPDHARLEVPLGEPLRGLVYQLRAVGQHEGEVFAPRGQALAHDAGLARARGQDHERRAGLVHGLDGDPLVRAQGLGHGRAVEEK